MFRGGDLHPPKPSLVEETTRHRVRLEAFTNGEKKGLLLMPITILLAVFLMLPPIIL